MVVVRMKRRRIIASLGFLMLMGIAVYFRLWAIHYSISSDDSDLLREAMDKSAEWRLRWPQSTVPTFKILACECLHKVWIGEQISLVPESNGVNLIINGLNEVIPEAKDVVRVDLVGGFALQKTVASMMSHGEEELSKALGDPLYVRIHADILPAEEDLIESKQDEAKVAAEEDKSNQYANSTTSMVVNGVVANSSKTINRELIGNS
ncbi:hypothetical protein Ahy_B10g102814 isoform B [Arachis hypogaea]|uniref:Uncharacterized protein n=1 Tax=Arachis hypogaea TaxID=3818 RepID=A0A444X2M9_ARAHY|nr:hypothetical protein Ahy_B10g102814 isoform B [Arachis hypogaea]